MSPSPGTVSSFSRSTSNTSGIGTQTGPQFLWGNPTSCSEQHSHSSAWPTSSVGQWFTSNGHGQGSPCPGRHGSFIGSHHYQCLAGFAPSEVSFLQGTFGSNLSNDNQLIFIEKMLKLALTAFFLCNFCSKKEKLKHNILSNERKCLIEQFLCKIRFI